MSSNNQQDEIIYKGGLIYSGTGFVGEKIIEQGGGTSIFDPVLCEIAYRWFCPVGGMVVDPFAGGSVRGIVAAKLGRKYIGVDLSERQIAANQKQAKLVCKTDENIPDWRVGDSTNISRICSGVKADFIFSCPPYVNLEVYSENPKDLSTMDYDIFIKTYTDIIKQSITLLKDDRFACFVVGEVRGKDGNYYGFVPDTVNAFKAAGAKFYNEAILITMGGTIPLLMGRPFVKSRKLGKTHQNVLFFIKGSAKKATEAIGHVEFGSLDEFQES